MNRTYEVKDGRLLVNGEPVPLRRGQVSVALLRAGWKGVDGPLPPEIVRKIVEFDRRSALLALVA